MDTTRRKLHPVLVGIYWCFPASIIRATPVFLDIPILCQTRQVEKNMPQHCRRMHSFDRLSANSHFAFRNFNCGAYKNASMICTGTSTQGIPQIWSTTVLRIICPIERKPLSCCSVHKRTRRSVMLHDSSPILDRRNDLSDCRLLPTTKMCAWSLWGWPKCCLPPLVVWLHRSTVKSISRSLLRGRSRKILSKTTD